MKTKTTMTYENGLTVVKTESFDGVMWKYFNENGEFHREDGPALIYPSGTKVWYKNGQFHREDGPAVFYSNGTDEWYLNGVYYSFDEWCEKVNIRNNEEWYKMGKRNDEASPAVIYSVGMKGNHMPNEQIQKEESMFFYIINDNGDYWSNEFGWVYDFNESTLFDDEIHNLPIGGYINQVTNMRELYEHPQFYPVKDAIDRAFDQFMEELKTHNVPAANDDRAEKLINQMVHYVISSGKIKL